MYSQKCSKMPSDKSKPLYQVFSWLLHIRTVAEENFLWAYLCNNAALSTPMLDARDLDKG